MAKQQIDLESFNKLPTAGKIGIAIGLVAAITGGNYYFFIQDADKQIKRNKATITKNETEITDKKIIAENLTQFQREHELLKQQLAEALTALPLSDNLDELLTDMNDNANKAGLLIRNLSPKPKIAYGFYQAIPLDMTVSGTYHEIAVFLESLSKLRRIVNVSGLSLSSAHNENDRIVLTAKYVATTFQFIETQDGSK
jgi:Tfp pilus assembly protein PilO